MNAPIAIAPAPPPQPNYSNLKFQFLEKENLTRLEYLKLFLRKHRSLLMLFSSTLVLVTFIAREGLRDELKDRMAEIEQREGMMLQKNEPLVLKPLRVELSPDPNGRAKYDGAAADFNASNLLYEIARIERESRLQKSHTIDAKKLWREVGEMMVAKVPESNSSVLQFEANMKLIASKIEAIKADESFENPLDVAYAEEEMSRFGLLYAIANAMLIIVVVIGVLFNLLAAWADISLPGAA